MVKNWLLLFTLFFSCVTGSLKDNPYGFYFFDIGITEQDLADFNSLDVQAEKFYHQFGELSNTERGIADFLSKIGENDENLVLRVASRLTQITNQFMASSQRETAWVHLRASVPTTAYDIPRWHMDGPYFTAAEDEQMYKFAVTLIGAPTLFYLLPQELRQTAWRHMRNRKFMQEFCHADLVVSPKQGEGALFLGGRKNESALHTEPPIHQNRLFFSIIPCNEKQLIELKAKVIAIYPKE